MSLERHDVTNKYQFEHIFRVNSNHKIHLVCLKINTYILGIAICENRNIPENNFNIVCISRGKVRDIVKSPFQRQLLDIVTNT